MSYYAYLGPLGEVVRHGAPFIASKDGFLIGTYNTFGEAMESLAWKGRTSQRYLKFSALRCFLWIASLGGSSVHSAPLSPFKIESDINGILPAGGGPLPFISFRS